MRVSWLSIRAALGSLGAKTRPHSVATAVLAFSPHPRVLILDPAESTAKMTTMYFETSTE